MKEKAKKLSFFIFILSFCIAYIALSYLVPGWRIKLEADKLTYFIENLKHMVLLKSLLSFLSALLISLGFKLMKNKEK